MRKQIVCCLLISVLLLAIINISLVFSEEAANTEKVENKISDPAPIEDNFEDNRILVVITHEESLKFKNYSEKDFPEIACKSVENLSTAAAERVQAKLRGEQLDESDINAAFMNRNVKVEKFKTILCLELETPGKENVLKAVELLQKREDIYSVSPNYFLSFDMAEP